MENRKTSSRKRVYAQSATKTRIPFLGGRPKRDTAVDRDDLVNLAILLNVCKTVDELLESL